MQDIVSNLALVILIYGMIHYTVLQMKKTGVVFTLLIYAKWFIGVLVTMFAFYVIYLAGELCKEYDVSVVFSLPAGVFAWYIPMKYLSQMFAFLEEKFKKDVKDI